VPATNVYFYREAPGDVPVLDWLGNLRKKDKKAYANCIAKIRMLAAFGHELRRPHADALRGGIRELRVKSGNVNYRILYFAHGRNVAILAHALTKEGAVPDGDIERALARKLRFEANPARHTAEVEISDA
jgi:phage-related protein